MSGETELYCRLCAEPTPIAQLITPREDVAFTSKVITKLSWINIDICSPNGLPNTICFTCFDLLERTWCFLNNVRTAQEKLSSIFLKNSNRLTKTIENDAEDTNLNIPGKPVDADWGDFQIRKLEIKTENCNENESIDVTNQHSVSPSGYNNGIVKAENDTDDDFFQGDSNNCFLSSLNSHIPLNENIVNIRPTCKDSLTNDDNSKLPIDVLSFNVTWENQMCRCAKCDSLCKSILSLQLHSLEIHNQCCMFKCIDCKKVINNYRTFVKHLRSHNSALRLCCEHCNKVFTLKSQLQNHKVDEHTGIYKTKCTYCGINFETDEDLEEHKSMFFKELSHKIEQKCDQCSKIFKSRYSLVMHKLLHTERSRNFVCHECGKKFYTKNTLRSHVETHYEVKRYKCDQCGKIFKSRYSLVMHKLLHTERSRNFECHDCGKKFYTKSTLCSHMETHYKVKCYKCDRCPMAFRARRSLISHLKLHSGLKPFVCEQCGKSFPIKQALVRHARVHADLKPYVCEYCNKAFRYKTGLNVHLRQHTGVKPYKCKYCQREFVDKSDYNKHMSRRHGIDTSPQIKDNVVNKSDLNESSETAV